MAWRPPPNNGGSATLGRVIPTQCCRTRRPWPTERAKTSPGDDEEEELETSPFAAPCAASGSLPSRQPPPCRPGEHTAKRPNAMFRNTIRCNAVTVSFSLTIIDLAVKAPLTFTSPERRQQPQHGKDSVTTASSSPFFSNTTAETTSSAFSCLRLPVVPSTCAAVVIRILLRIVAASTNCPPPPPRVAVVRMSAYDSSARAVNSACDSSGRRTTAACRRRRG